MLRTSVYLHSSKENMWSKGEELGLNENAIKKFIYICYEVKIDLEVDEETGDAEIIAVDGRRVLPKLSSNAEESVHTHDGFKGHGYVEGCPRCDWLLSTDLTPPQDPRRGE